MKLTKEEELQLLHDCINAGGCDRLVQYYWKPVFFMVRKTFILTGVSFTEDELEDLRGEVFLNLFDNKCKKLRQYKADMGLSLTSWIKMIAYQTVKMYLRKSDRSGILGPYKTLSLDRLREELGLENGGEMMSDPGKTPSQMMEDMENLTQRLDAREQLARFLESIENLPPFDQFVLKLHFFDGLPLSEIADRLGKEIGNIYTIKFRAIKRLKKLMFDV